MCNSIYLVDEWRHIVALFTRKYILPLTVFDYDVGRTHAEQSGFGRPRDLCANAYGLLIDVDIL